MKHVSEGTPIRVIGDKVQAKYKTFYNDKLERLHQAWIPYIEVDGQMMGIYDESTESGQVEAETRRDALKKAKQIRDETRARLADRQKSTNSA